MNAENAAPRIRSRTGVSEPDSGAPQDSVLVRFTINLLHLVPNGTIPYHVLVPDGTIVASGRELMVRRSGCLRPQPKREPTMKIRRSHNYVMAAALAVATCCAWPVLSGAQGVYPGDPGFGEQLVKAVLASPGALGIETGRTIKGRLVIFAWFENKKALVDWYKSDFH